jgi:thiol-disulfide isomerase/thioredoxin
MILMCLSLVAVPQVISAAGIAGRWNAAVVINQAEVPFRFDVVQKGNAVHGYFFEGDRRVGSTSGRFVNGTLTLEYDFLNTILEVALEGNRLHGTYRNKRPNTRPMEFHADRFKPAATAVSGNAPPVAGAWVMYRTSQDKSKLDLSWRLYLRQSGSEVSGAILKTSGDSGTLVGRWKDGRLTMSHFAGERPLLFEAELRPDGTLLVTLDREFTYRAARTAEASANGLPTPPDLSRFTSVRDPADPFHFSGLDLDGKTVSDADARFRGRVVVLTIGGSWCPNCHDEAPFLVDLYNEFKAGGLEVVGLFFENDANLTVARPRILSFVARHSVPFPILVLGTTDEAAKKLPQLVNFGVYPTTLILGRDGRVRNVHAGFASAATGVEHVRLTREKRELVMRLLAEKSPARSEGQE